MKGEEVEGSKVLAYFSSSFSISFYCLFLKKIFFDKLDQTPIVYQRVSVLVNEKMHIYD